MFLYNYCKALTLLIFQRVHNFIGWGHSTQLFVNCDGPRFKSLKYASIGKQVACSLMQRCTLWASIMLSSFLWNLLIYTLLSIMHQATEIHSGYFYSASSSPLLLRSAPDMARILCRNFTPKHHRQLWVKDLPKVPTWQLERELDPWPFRWKSSTQPMRHPRPTTDQLIKWSQPIGHWHKFG